MGLLSKAIKATGKAIDKEIKRKQKEKEEAALKARQWLKIVQDCAKLVNETVNPEVFFSRYRLMLENLKKLVGLEKTGVFSKSKEMPSTALSRMEKQFTAATNDFLDRSFADAKAKADALKTETGKANTMQRYFEKIEKYVLEMEVESVNHYNELREKHYTT